jgi:ABC-2 type transport system permease protein
MEHPESARWSARGAEESVTSTQPGASATEAGPRPATENTRDLARRPTPMQRLRDLFEYRELLGNLVRKELKIKYKNSVLGFLWSLLNPALYLVVFYFVFQVVLGSGIPKFAIFLLCGLVPWNFFSAALGAGTTSITGNASLVGKVWFPREVLPIAAIGAALVHFFLQSIVLVLGLVVFGIAPNLGMLWLLVPALFVMILFLAGAALLLSAVNVYLRDTQHLLELLLLAWFWATPIVYTYFQIAAKLHGFAFLYYLGNPMTSVVLTFQRVLYNRTSYTTKTIVTVGKKQIITHPVTPLIPNESMWWFARNLGIIAVMSAVLLFIALSVFGRLEDNFAEEI